MFLMRIDWHNIALLFLVVFLSGCPKPLEPEVAVDQLQPQVYDYAGIKVIQVYTPRAPLEFRFVFQGIPDWNNGSRPFQSRLALSTALRGGAGDWSPSEVAMRIDTEKLLLDFSVGDGCAWLRMACLPDQLDSSWEVFQSIIMASQLDEQVLTAEQKAIRSTHDLLKEEALFGLGKLVRSKGFGLLGMGSGNGLEPGSELPGMDIVSNWYSQKLIAQGRLALVVVGDVDGETIADLLFASLSNLPARGWEGNDPSYAPVPLNKGVFVEKALGESEAIALHLPLADAKTKLYGQDLAAEAGLMVYWEVCKTRIRQLFAHDPLLLSQLRFRFETGLQPGGWMVIDGQRIMAPTELAMSNLRSLYQSPPSAAEIETARANLLTKILRPFQSNRNLADHLAAAIGTGHLQDLIPRLKTVQTVGNKDIIAAGSTALEHLSWFYVGTPSRVDRNNLTRLE